MIWIVVGMAAMVLSVIGLVFSGAGDSAFGYATFIVAGAVLFGTGMIVETIKAAELRILSALRAAAGKETRNDAQADDSRQ